MAYKGYLVIDMYDYCINMGYFILFHPTWNKQSLNYDSRLCGVDNYC